VIEKGVKNDLSIFLKNHLKQVRTNPNPFFSSSFSLQFRPTAATAASAPDSSKVEQRTERKIDIL